MAFVSAYLYTLKRLSVFQMRAMAHSIDRCASRTSPHTDTMHICFSCRVDKLTGTIGMSSSIHSTSASDSNPRNQAAYSITFFLETIQNLLQQEGGTENRVLGGKTHFLAGESGVIVMHVLYAVSVTNYCRSMSDCWMSWPKYVRGDNIIHICMEGVSDNKTPKISLLLPPPSNKKWKVPDSSLLLLVMLDLLIFLTEIYSLW